MCMCTHMQINSHAWDMHIDDPQGIRAAAAAQLISSCGKFGLKDITKTHVFELSNREELDLFAELHLDPSAAESPCKQMLKLLEVPSRCVLGPVSYAGFWRLLESSSVPLTARHTWIVIVRVEPLPVADEEPTSPAQALAPDCPATGDQPWEAQFNAFMQEAMPAADAADAAHTELPRALQPHHFVVAWRRTADEQHAPTLMADSDFRTHGQQSPVVHHVPPLVSTPGLPPGASDFETLHPM